MEKQSFLGTPKTFPHPGRVPCTFLVQDTITYLLGFASKERKLQMLLLDIIHVFFMVAGIMIIKWFLLLCGLLETLSQEMIFRHRYE